MKSDLRNNTNKIRIITYFFQHFKFVISNQDDRVSMKKYKTLLVSPPLFLFLISDRNSLAYLFRKSSKQSRDNLASDFKKKKKQNNSVMMMATCAPFHWPNGKPFRIPHSTGPLVTLRVSLAAAPTRGAKHLN